MGSVPMPWRNTHAMTFSAMIPYVVYGIRKCGLSSRIGNICSLHGAATGSPLSESRGRSDAPQRSRVLVRLYVQQSVQALAHVAQSLSALGQDRCTRHQEALVVAWQPLPVADPPNAPGIIEPTQASLFHARNRSTHRDCKGPVSACPPGVEHNCNPRVCRSDLPAPARLSRWAIARTARRGLCMWRAPQIFPALPRYARCQYAPARRGAQWPVTGLCVPPTPAVIRALPWAAVAGRTGRPQHGVARWSVEEAV